MATGAASELRPLAHLVGLGQRLLGGVIPSICIGQAHEGDAIDRIVQYT